MKLFKGGKSEGSYSDEEGKVFDAKVVEAIKFFESWNGKIEPGMIIDASVSSVAGLIGRTATTLEALERNLPKLIERFLKTARWSFDIHHGKRP